MGRSWVETETAGCELGDARLNRRLEAMLEALGERPGKSLPTAFQDWSNTKAAYRFFPTGMSARTRSSRAISPPLRCASRQPMVPF
jgi:hypothetical protein